LVRLDPEDAQARINLGVALAQAGDFAGAIREHQKVLKLKPDDKRLALTHFNLATFYSRTNDPRRALEHYGQALERDPGLEAAHFELAELLSRGGRLAEALPHYARVSELEPGHETVRLREAEVLMRLGRFDDAKNVLEEAVKTFPSDGRAAHALVRLLVAAPELSLRDGPRALAMATRRLETNREPPHAETLAMALAEVGRFEDATRTQRAVLAEARRLHRTADTERLARNLARYESRTACCADPTDAYPPVMPDSPFAEKR
jgi:tetratricopeptide (TPR) repeat protein